MNKFIYEHHVGILYPGKFVFVNPRGSKGSKLLKTAKNETFWSITFVPYIKFF